MHVAVVVIDQGGHIWPVVGSLSHTVHSSSELFAADAKVQRSQLSLCQKETRHFSVLLCTTADGEANAHVLSVVIKQLQNHGKRMHDS